MTTPEQNNEQAKLTAQQIKEKIVNTIGNMFEQVKREKAQDARAYIEEGPQKVEDPSSLTPEQKNKRQEQKNRLEELKNILTPNTQEGQMRGIALQIVVQQAIVNLAENSDLPTFQTRFFTELSRVRIPENLLLPYARFVFQTAEKTYDDSASEALQKARLALEIFIGETDDKSGSFALVKNIFSALGKSHDTTKLLDEQEFKALCDAYNLTEDERRQLQEALQLKELEEEHSGQKKELQEIKDEILSSFFAGDPDAAEKRAKLDLFLLTLSPDSGNYRRLSQLIQTAPDPRFAEVGRQDPKAAAKERQFSELVEGWIREFEEEQGVNLTPAQVEQLKDYFRQYRDSLDSYRLGFIRRSYMMPQNIVNDMIAFEQSLIQAAIMISSNNEFFFREYFKGKVAELLRKKGTAAIDEYLQIARGGSGSFTINYEDLQRQIFSDIRQLLFSAMRSHEDPYALLYRQTADSMRILKGMVSQKVQLGGTDEISGGPQGVIFKFEFEELTEMNVEGYRELVAQSKYDASYAFIVGTYLARAESFAKLYAGLSEFAKKAETGNAEEILKAAQAITNEQLDLFFLESPIIKYAISSYIRIIKNAIAINGGVLTPDILQRPTYSKKTLEKLLEDDLKSTFSMTDQEKDIYLAVAKALAIASGDLPDILAAAMPPLDTIKPRLSAEIQKKIEQGESLSIQELKEVYRELNISLHDHPFRGLLVAMNPLKWIFAWLNTDEYNNHLLGYVPMMPGHESFGPFDMFRMSQKIRDSIYYGLDDETARYFREDWLIPVLELNRLTSASLQRRLGWRTHAFVLRHEDVVLTTVAGEQRIDGEATFRKLLQRSPMLAYQFITIKKTNYMNIAVSWGGKDDLGSETRREYIKEILKFCHANHPTFFIQNEERRFFRKDELSFNEELQTLIAASLGRQPKDEGYWLFLSSFERSDELIAKSQPSRFGDTSFASRIRSRIVFSRLVELFTSAETFLYEHKDEGISIQSFILNPQDERFSGLYKTLLKRIDKQRDLYGLEGSSKEILQQFIEFAKRAFYEGDSVYESKKFRGFLGKNDQQSILDYYTTLVADNKILNPFDWSYMGGADPWFQRTGLNMIARNVSMFAAFLGYSSKMGNVVSAVKDIIRIRHPEKGMEIAKKTLDSFKDAFMQLLINFGETEADKAAWMTMAYMMQAFTPSRLKDIPIFGMIPVLESWATLMNPDDKLKVNAWNARRRKEIFDYAQNKPWQERIISSKGLRRGLTTKIKGAKDIDKLKLKLFGKETEIQIPHFLLRMFPRLAIEMSETYSKGAKDFSASSLRHFLKIERPWIATNLILTITIIGMLLITLEAIREGLKEAEIK